MTRLLRAATFLALSAAFALRAGAQQDRVVVLENADSLVGLVIDGQDARELIGNVRLAQGNVRITCDRALQFLRSGTVHLTGNVVVTDDSLTLTSPRGTYHRDARRAEAFEKVRLTDGRMDLTAEYGEYLIESRTAFFRSRVRIRDSASVVMADSLVFYRDTRRSVATGSVRVESPADRLFILGGRLEHEPDRGMNRITVNPVLLQTDTTGGVSDTLIVRSQIMESIRDSLPRLVAIDSVQILRGELSALSGRAVFFTQGDSILLRGSPVVWYQDSQTTGDSIDMALESRSLREVFVMGNALTLSRADSLRPSRYNQLTGETLLMQFARRRLQTVRAEVRAMSIYYAYEDTAANGVTTSTGDRITLLFDEGRVRSISIQGGVEGEYHPEPLVVGREAEFRVPGFLFRPDRPTMNNLEIPWTRLRKTAG
jgi:lipopolysaccharide export system protein LptA